MPGTVRVVNVAPSQKVARGELLLTLEAMKMETAVRVEMAATVAEVLVRPKQFVDTKDLLITLE